MTSKQRRTDVGATSPRRTDGNTTSLRRHVRARMGSTSWIIPVGTRRRTDAAPMSMQRSNVASTSVRRHLDVVYPPEWGLSIKEYHRAFTRYSEILIGEKLRSLPSAKFLRS